jgi:uncharacterized spore protein YtfJ
MEMEKFLERLEDLKSTASVEAVFGEPEVIGERTIIPVAKVGYGLAFGFGRGEGPAAAEGEPTGEGVGEGGGGGVSATPVAVLEINPQGTRVVPVLDTTRIAIAGILMVAWNVFIISFFISKARRQILGK